MSPNARKSGNEKEYLVCYTLFQLGYKPQQNALNKMNHWALIFSDPTGDMIQLTMQWLKKFDVTNVNPGTFNIVLDNMGTSGKKRTSTTADIVVYLSDPAKPIAFSIKNNNTFLKSPCPSAFVEQAGLETIAAEDYNAKYTSITEDWYDELQSRFGGRFPIKDDKISHYTVINNLVKSFLITYDADKYIKFILDIGNDNDTNPDKYIIKYNKNTVYIYKIDIKLSDYKVVVGDVKDTFLYINLVHKKKKMDPIEIKLRIKNYEGYVRRSSKVLPIKYTVSIRNFDRFKCLATSK